MKKVWEKPKLVALVRSKPEENVLGVCKGIVGSSPDDSYQQCVEIPCYGDCEVIIDT